MNGELKPCPFCGSDDMITSRYDYEDPTAYGCQVICADCGARVESNMGDVKLHQSPGKAEESAMKHWNTRAERTCHVEHDDELGDSCSECGFKIGFFRMLTFCPNCGARIED